MKMKIRETNASYALDYKQFLEQLMEKWSV